MESALKEINRPPKGVFLSGLSAGLNLSFGALLMGMALTFSGGFESKLVQQAILGGVSSIAFLFVVIGQTELFTAHSTMAILPVLDGRATVQELGRVWGVTYVSNLVGCALFAGLITIIGPALGIVDVTAFGTLASALLPYSWWVIFLSGVIAGWLMGLVTWLSAASRDTVSRILFVLLITGVIGAGPFHHSILGPRRFSLRCFWVKVSLSVTSATSSSGRHLAISLVEGSLSACSTMGTSRLLVNSKTSISMPWKRLNES